MDPTDYHSNNLKAVSTLSEAHPETMDFLSSAWCNFAVQALQPEFHDANGSSILVRDNTMKSTLDMVSHVFNNNFIIIF